MGFNTYVPCLCYPYSTPGRSGLSHVTISKSKPVSKSNSPPPTRITISIWISIQNRQDAPSIRPVVSYPRQPSRRPDTILRWTADGPAFRRKLPRSTGGTMGWLAFKKLMMICMLSLVAFTGGFIGYRKYMKATEFKTWLKLSATVVSARVIKERRSKGITYCPAIQVRYSRSLDYPKAIATRLTSAQMASAGRIDSIGRSNRTCRRGLNSSSPAHKRKYSGKRGKGSN